MQASETSSVRTDPADIAVERCTMADRDDWNAFLSRSERGTFYHLFDWRDINSKSFGHTSPYLLARRERAIVGVLPLTLIESRLFGRILCSMPFVNFGGPCSPAPAVRAALAQSAVTLADELGVDHLELRCTDELDAGLPVSTRKVSMTLDLAPDPQTLWNAFTSKHRNNIRRAEKNGLTVKSGGLDLLPPFYDVMQQSWHSLGTPLYALSYFENILKALPEHTRIFVCHRGDEPVGVAFNGYFEGTVEGMWAGGTPLSRPLQANYVLYWEMIRDACTHGFRSFHLGRSTTESGSEDFKRKWNAQSQQLYWYFHVPGGGAMPAVNVDNPKYKLAIAAWQRMPPWVIRMLGPRLAPSIP
jgi:FemAB-related protein (PEP-CTERM system-associated)